MTQEKDYVLYYVDEDGFYAAYVESDGFTKNPKFAKLFTENRAYEVASCESDLAIPMVFTEAEKFYKQVLCTR